MMADMDIDEEKAKACIEEAEVELEQQRSKGSENVDAQRSLKQARSFLRVGLFEQAYLTAVKAKRLLESPGQR